MRGCFNAIKAVAPVIMAREHGHIVNVGSRVAYSASRWGLRGIVRSFALEPGPHNINVAPGMLDGPRFREKVRREMADRLGISEEEAARRHAGRC
jgi:NAD(P)-dependent dehydrogenase (short-subunit alcohol dehydrogenase family)